MSNIRTREYSVLILVLMCVSGILVPPGREWNAGTDADALPASTDDEDDIIMLLDEKATPRLHRHLATTLQSKTRYSAWGSHLQNHGTRCEQLPQEPTTV